MKALLSNTAAIIAQMRELTFHRPARIAAGVLVLGGASIVNAHEFWLAPHRYSVAAGEEVAASLRVGQMLKGAELPYLSSGFSDFTVRTRAGTRTITGFEGDLPAVSYPAKQSGLHVITYHSTANTLRYESWEKFLDYLAYEGLEQLAAEHVARGLPRQGFGESYVRESRAPVGSSVSSNFGSFTNARAIATRCISPPES